MTKVTTAALGARVVLTAVPTDTYALSLLPLRDVRTHFIEDAHHLMSGDAWILKSRPQPFLHEHVTVAYATGLYLNAHLPCARCGNRAFDYLEIRSRLRHLRYLHRCYCDCRCHKCLLKHYCSLFG